MQNSQSPVLSTWCVDFEPSPHPSTGITPLQRYYGPLRDTASPSQSLTGVRLTSRKATRQGFPCFVWVLLPNMPSAIPRQNHRLHFPFSSPVTATFPIFASGRLRQYRFRGLLSDHSHVGLHARQIPFRPLYNKGFSRFVTCTSAPVATGRNVNYRAGFAPAGRQHLGNAR